MISVANDYSHGAFFDRLRMSLGRVKFRNKQRGRVSVILLLLLLFGS